MATFRSSLGGVGLLGLALAGAGCGSGAPHLITTPEVAVLVGADSKGGADARAGGTVTLLGSCLGIVGDGGVGEFVVMWPSGTEVVDDGPQVRLPDSDDLVDLGSRISAGGGYYEPWAGEPALPDTCSTDDVVVVHDLEVPSSRSRAPSPASIIGES